MAVGKYQVLPIRPFLVVTTITPLAARVPYKAVADASFNTSIRSMSEVDSGNGIPDNIQITRVV